MNLSNIICDDLRMVSVCIATYNGEKFILQQVNSILEQIGKSDELIISDDGSKDNTLEIIKQIGDCRIRIYINNTRHGVIGNFQNALMHARGEYIFLADQDDIWLPNKYNTILTELKYYDLVHSDSIVTDSKLNVIYSSFYEEYNNGKGIIKNMIKSTYFGSHMAFKRELLESVLPFPNSDEIGHDLWIGLVAEMVGRVSFIDDKLILYRRHENTYCTLGIKSHRSLFKKIKGRIIMSYHVIKFKIKRGNKK